MLDEMLIDEMIVHEMTNGLNKISTQEKSYCSE